MSGKKSRVTAPPTGRASKRDVPEATDGALPYCKGVTVNNKFAVKAWRDYHGMPTLFRVVDEAGCEVGRFPSEAAAIGKAAALEIEERLLQELATRGSEAPADITYRYREYVNSLSPLARERLWGRVADTVRETSPEE